MRIYVQYHVKAQPALSLRIKHDEIHNADYCPDTAPLAFPLNRSPLFLDGGSVPVNMFLYHFKISSLLISDGFLLSSTMIPSESITLYVGIAGCVDGCSKVRSVVNLLFTAPGKWTLETISFCVML